jgi:hypothetical protein
VAHTLRICDEITGAGRKNEFQLDFPTEKVTVRELIRTRICWEVQDYNARGAGEYRGLVEPIWSERTPEGVRPKKGIVIDWRGQVEVALQAFVEKRILVMVDDRQVASLDEAIAIAPRTRVTFMKVLPVVGG